MASSPASTHPQVESAGIDSANAPPLSSNDDILEGSSILPTLLSSATSTPIHFIQLAAHVPIAVARVRALAPRAISVDLEGVNLSRDGEVCIVQVAVARRGAPVFLFDISALGAAAFDGADSLRGLLEDAALEKLFFDCRADANALFFLHGVETANVVDLQLCDVAHRLAHGMWCDRVSGLGFLVEKTPHARLSAGDCAALAACKAAAHKLFVPELGGSYEVWRERPLPAVLLEYCTDATLFFTIRASFDAALLERYTDAQAASIRAAAAAAATRRLSFAHCDEYCRSDRDRLVAIDPELKAAIREVVGVQPAAGWSQWRGGGGGGGGGGRGRGGRGRGGRGRGRGS